MLRLARMNVLPPGGFQYVQPETGMKFDGNTLYRAQIRAISTHRKANALKRSSIDESEEDLMAFTCSRMPGLCVGSNEKPNPLAKASNTAPRRKCGSCGGKKAK